MRHLRISLLVLLFVSLPVSLLAAAPTGAGSFFVKAPGSEREIPISNATFKDQVYFRVHVHANDGDHAMQITIYDGSGREVCNAESTLFVKDGTGVDITSYGFSSKRDASGTWWYVAAVDGKVVASESLNVGR